MFVFSCIYCVLLCVFSETTTQEVIVMLLQKFKITDNPRKFALYEHTVFKDNKCE